MLQSGLVLSKVSADVTGAAAIHSRSRGISHSWCYRGGDFSALHRQKMPKDLAEHDELRAVAIACQCALGKWGSRCCRNNAVAHFLR